VGHVKNFFSFSFIIIFSDYITGTQLKQARWKDGTAIFFSVGQQIKHKFGSSDLKPTKP